MDSLHSADTLKELRFFWENYKFMLDILKNNNKFEELFLKVAEAIFDFCIKFDRKSEFKRLCDLVSYFSINLAEVESSIHQIQIRMSQLRTSIQLQC